MRVLIFGATGRVGAAALGYARAAGHEVTAFVRDPAKLVDAGVATAKGDVLDPDAVRAALAARPDAILNAVGVDPLKPSTFVTDAARVLVSEAEAAGVGRYVAVSGTAQMKKAILGEVSAFVLDLTPVHHAIHDHQGAYDIVTASSLDWTLAGCPWIKDSSPEGPYGEHDVFPGGMKTVHPTQVGHFLVKVLDQPVYYHRIVGVWHD